MFVDVCVFVGVCVLVCLRPVLVGVLVFVFV